MRRSALALAVALVTMMAPAFAKSNDLLGRWAVRSGGQTFMIVDVTHDNDKFSATILRPTNGRISYPQAAVEISGPVKALTLREQRRGPNSIDFAAKDSLTEISVLTLVDQDRMSLRYINGSLLEPILFSRARDGENVSLDWSTQAEWHLDQSWPDNALLVQMFKEDQEIRKEDSNTDWEVAQAEDRKRREAVQKLLDENKLHSGTDFYYAAFIFQHGQQPADYLKAHVLATIAATRGRRDAIWISAATLDRYLQSIGQKQIFGTQFRFPTDDTVTQEPYDRTLLTDAIRAVSRVPDLVTQDIRLKELEADLQK